MPFIREPNDTTLTAYNVGSIGAVPFIGDGIIGDDANNLDVVDYSDVDIFRLDLQAGDRLVVDVDAYDLGSPIDPLLRLFVDTNGDGLADDLDGDGDFTIAFNDDWLGLDPRLDYTTEFAGTYYIGLSDLYNPYDPHQEGTGFGYGSGNYTITIAVNPPNLAPVANPDASNAAPNATTTIFAWEVLMNDFDPEYDTFTINTLVVGEGTQSVELNELGDIVFTPVQGLMNTTATFTYTLSDALGNISEPATVSVQLGAILRGSWRSDRLFGTEQSDYFEGRGGNDALVSLDGNDILFGGSGRDTLNGGVGNDRLVGGADADVLLLRTYEDTVVLERLEDSGLSAPDIAQVAPDYYGAAYINVDAPGSQDTLFSSSAYPLVTDSLGESCIKDLLEILDPDNNFFRFGVATFRYTNSNGIARDFLAIDDGVLVDGHRSFSASRDAIIELRGGASVYNFHIS